MAVEDPEGGDLMESRFDDLPPDVREHILERLNRVLDKMTDVTKEVTTALRELGALIEEISCAQTSQVRSSRVATHMTESDG